jgi:hypothetical protein
MKITNMRLGIASALTGINGTGSWAVDLSGSSQVIHGIYATPPRAGLPAVMIGSWGIERTRGPQLGRYEQEALFPLLCWAPAPTDDAGARMLAIETMVNDIVIALETSARVSGGALQTAGAYDVLIKSIGDVEGLNGDIGGFAVFVVGVLLYSRADKLGGV